MAERFTRVPRVRESGVQILEQLNLTQRCKRFSTALTSTQINVLPGAMTR